MLSTSWSVTKQNLLPSMARCVAKMGLLPIVLSMADRWGKKGEGDWPAVIPFIKRRWHIPFQILVYHRVNDAQDPFFGGVPVQDFARQMEMISRYFRVLPLEELVERAQTGDVPPRAVAITFDDGYKDNYQHAFPILKQFGLPATIFLATGAIDSESLLWHDRVFDAFRRTCATSLAIEGTTYPLATLAEKRVALRTFLQHVRHRSPRARDDRIRQLTGELGVPQPCYAAAQKLSWQEIEDMSKAYIAFGAHTVTHPILSHMPLADAVDEIIASKATIERRLQSPVRLFAYPNGSRDDFDVLIKQALRDAGFRCAVTSLWGSNCVHTDPFELRRVGIWDRNPQVAALKLGWYKFLS